MSTVKKFEDLICWQKARELTRLIYLNFKPLNDWGFKDQIQRASVSVMSNIAEGFERGTRQELINYLYIAKASCGEVRAQLYVALDAGYLNSETFKRLNSLSAECASLIYKFISSVKSSSYSGLQHKKYRSKEIPDYIKFLLNQQPELKQYYNEDRQEIEWWRYDQDKSKTP